MADDLQRWFDRRTFSAGQFDVEDLVRRKAAAGTTVSVVLPARNEAATVAGVIRAVRVLEGRLVDEVVVLDGGSSDGTADIAAEAGARVVDDSGVLPEHGRALGKGDALWRSLATTSGDLIAFVDTDIANPDPRFVWALLAPLLHDPGVAFVKAFYDRPVRVGEVLHPTGGGRVTELTARPLLNLLWPELAGIVQPLSGEYAGRRSLLEAIPFFTGYGVEIGLLVDTLRHSGADAIAQVDLDVRVHRNQEVEALSRMAFGILQVALQRLGEEGRCLVRDLSERYVQFERGDDGAVRLLHRDVGVVERPPLVSLGP